MTAPWSTRPRPVSFAAVKAQVSLVAVLHRYLPESERAAYRAKGEQLRGPCPLCGHRRPSLSIHTGKSIFRCFHCQAAGNVLDFVAAKEGVDLPRAARLLARWFELAPAVPVEETSGADDTTESTPEPELTEHRPLTFELKHIDPAHRALRGLGVSRATLEAFGAGVYGGRGHFKDHLVVPIHNADGVLVGYVGYPLTRQGLGAAVYPPRFQPALELFNAHRAAARLADSPQALVVVADPLDTLYLHEHGVPASVATFTTPPSRPQLRGLQALCGERPFVTVVVPDEPPVWVGWVQALHTTALFYRLRPLPKPLRTGSPKELPRLLA